MAKRIAVIGAGLVGSAAALGLMRQGFEVVLIDGVKPERAAGRLGLDIRNVALNPQSQSLLASLGVWSEVPKVAYERMSIWEHTGTSVLNFSAADAQRSELGWIVENSPLQVALYDRCAAAMEVRLDSVAAIEVTDQQVGLRLDSGERCEVDFVVAVDGARSPTREFLGIPVKRHAVEQTALATVVRTGKSHQNCAWQRFLQDGPLALLPAADDDEGNHRVSIVWSQSAESAAAHRTLSDDEFCRALTQVSEACVGEITAVDERLTFPLTQQQAKTFVFKHKVVLLGDAARVVHPLAGLGVNLGFEDVLAFLQVTDDGLQIRGLNTFQRQRAQRSEHMIALLATLRKAYQERNPWLIWARNLAVGQLDRMDLVKRQIMQEAMGLGPIAQVAEKA